LTHASELKVPWFSPVEHVGKVFIRSLEFGFNYRTKVFHKIQDHDVDCHKNIKFLIEFGGDEYGEIIAYNKLCDTNEAQEDQEIHPEEPGWKFSSIEGHMGPKVIKIIRAQVIMSEDGSQSCEPPDSMFNS
jgi:hypothetical protein